MSTEAKQAAEWKLRDAGSEIVDECFKAFLKTPTPDKAQLLKIARSKIDTATAKLIDGLKQEKLDFEKEVSDHYAELHREFKRQLAHQQPMSLKEQHDKWMNMLGQPSATALKHVEKDMRCSITFTTEKDVEVLRALAQASEPLVGLLRRARRNVEHSASHPAGAASRELLAEIDVALADTEEKI